MAASLVRCTPHRTHLIGNGAGFARTPPTAAPCRADVLARPNSTDRCAPPQSFESTADRVDEAAVSAILPWPTVAPDMLADLLTTFAFGGAGITGLPRRGLVNEPIRIGGAPGGTV